MKNSGFCLNYKINHIDLYDVKRIEIDTFVKSIDQIIMNTFIPRNEISGICP